MDFGLYVRQCITNQTLLGSPALQRVVCYSIPFVKHNRLTFPSLNEINRQNLADLLKIMLVSCLGIIPGSARRPTFTNRVVIFKIIHTILTQGTTGDMHAFLSKCMNLVRVTVMEYFLYFTSQHMPLEMIVLMQMHCLEHRSNVIKCVQVCIDNFRQNSFQMETFDLEHVLAQAQICNDKCNRICKGKQRFIATTPQKFGLKMSTDTIKFALQYPHFQSPHIMKFAYPHLKMADIIQILHVQQSIKIFPMPANFVEIQKHHLQKMVANNTVSALESTNLCLCLHCLNHNNVGDTNMRVDSNQNLQCNRCMQNSAVVRINMIGRFVKINQYYFSYCVYCKRTHKCDSQMSHLFGCSNVKQTAPNIPKKECFVCEKTLNLTCLKVIDENVGCLHVVHLCRKHVPWNHRLSCVMTLSELAFEIKNKYSFLSPFNKKS